MCKVYLYVFLGSLIEQRGTTPHKIIDKFNLTLITPTKEGQAEGQREERNEENRETYITKLHETELAELGDAGVSGLALKEQLTQGHLLAAEERTHLRNWV